MNRSEFQTSKKHGITAFRPAPVLDVDEANGRIQVLLEGSSGSQEVWARSALPCDCELGCGDTVLIAGASETGLYIVGLLDAQTRGTVRRRQLILDNGAKAETDGERLKVFAASGELIFEHDPETGKSRIGVASGDLELVAPNGNIDFITAGGVRFYARAAIELNSLEGVKMATANPRNETLSALELTPEKIELKSAKLDVSAHKAELRLDETQLEGKKLTGTIKSVKLAMKRCETISETVIAKAKNVYQTVEELSQLKTGRLRHLVARTYQLRSKTALMKAEEDFNIDGEKINLG